MSVAELLADLARRGIKLEADGERLRYHPRSVMPLDLLDRLRANKPDLLKWLRGKPASGAASDLDDEFFDANESYWPQLSETDRNYLLGPRTYPTRCPWCSGRLVHHVNCDELRQSWEPTVPFGEHAGKRVFAVPRDYLTWLVRQPSIGRKLREAIHQRLKDQASL